MNAVVYAKVTGRKTAEHLIVGRVQLPKIHREPFSAGARSRGNGTPATIPARYRDFFGAYRSDILLKEDPLKIEDVQTVSWRLKY